MKNQVKALLQKTSKPFYPQLLHKMHDDLHFCTDDKHLDESIEEGSLMPRLKWSLKLV